MYHSRHALVSEVSVAQNVQGAVPDDLLIYQNDLLMDTGAAVDHTIDALQCVKGTLAACWVHRSIAIRRTSYAPNLDAARGFGSQQVTKLGHPIWRHKTREYHNRLLRIGDVGFNSSIKRRLVEHADRFRVHV